MGVSKFESRALTSRPTFGETRKLICGFLACVSAILYYVQF